MQNSNKATLPSTIKAGPGDGKICNKQTVPESGPIDCSVNVDPTIQEKLDQSLLRRTDEAMEKIAKKSWGPGGNYLTL